MTRNPPLYYDPYRRDIVENPYPVYKRLREEAPLYYNAEYDFYAVSRYADVKAGLADYQTFISGRGGILELIKENVTMPAGTFIFEDPPIHGIHRTLAQRFFTPKRMKTMEEGVRAITIDCLNKLAGRDEFDVIADIGTQVPMRVIGTMLGIPEQDFDKVRQLADAKMMTEAGKPMEYGGEFNMDDSYQEYIDWRAKNPGDDVITELLNVQFTDDHGVVRHLSKEEILTFVNVLAGAGNETTNKLIGWTCKLLAEHPDQRRELIANPGLIPNAIEEILRIEPPGPHIGRYVARDVVIHGQTVPAGSAIVFINASANRDESVFKNADQFDIHRDRSGHVSFGYGPHTCIGNALARVEGRVVLEELLKRIPEWDVDMENARLLCTSTVRGWETLPAYINATGAANIKARAAAEQQSSASAASAAPASIAGTWTVTVKGPTGPMDSELTIVDDGVKLKGSQTGEGTTTEVSEITYSDGQIEWINQITKPMKMKLTFAGTITGDTISGKVKAGFMGSYPFTGQRK